MDSKNKLKIVGLRELRNNMDYYVSEVAKGKSFIIARKSKAVFKIEPVPKGELVWDKNN